MLSTPFENLKHFLTSRPPLTIFVVCLATITLAGFGFAYYIDVADRVINGDEQQVGNVVFVLFVVIIKKKTIYRIGCIFSNT